MKKFLFLFTFLSIIYTKHGVAQGQGNVWCFGHYAAINFNSTFATPDTSAGISRGSCASVCDSAGNLLFYVSNDTVTMSVGPVNGAKVYTKNHVLMQFGDSINSENWYHELVIIPNPENYNKFYIFSIGVTSFFGIYYSEIDMSLNGGLGEVVQKNVQLQNFKQVDCLTAIKHGNGRDWWILFRKSDFPNGSNNAFYEYLVTPNGISNVISQNIGSPNSTNSGTIVFNNTGNKFIFMNLMGLMEYYDFDRCTGLISNPINIYPQQSSGFNRTFFNGQFSPSDKLYYTTSVVIPGYTDSCYLIQYNFLSSNIPLSADTIETTSIMNNMGHIKLGKDGKIYQSKVYNNFVTSSYPYPDTVFSVYNTYLSVIHDPDSIGYNCNFQAFGFYLGGKRTYYGLPNNPDYILGPLLNSPCDTLVGVSEILQLSTNSNLYVYYSLIWHTAFINVDKLTDVNYSLRVYDISGHQIFYENGKTKPPYFTKSLDCTNYVKGMYLINYSSGSISITKKLVVE